MASKYKHIFIDLDDTLWDYHKNSTEVLNELHIEHQLEKSGVTIDDFVRVFHEVNEELWDLFNKGLVEKDEIRDKRFGRIFKKLGLGTGSVPSGIDVDYLNRAPLKPHLMPYAKELLEHLSQRYVLHIVTNGFDDVQYHKLRASGIYSFFDKVITSDAAKAKKPDPKIFYYALDSTGATIDDVIMIGDRLETDMQGAKNAGIPHLYYNPKKAPHNQAVTHEVAHLEEICDLL